jgi:hypothetical protein
MRRYTIKIDEGELSYLQRALVRDMLELEEMSASMIPGLVEFASTEIAMATAVERKLDGTERDLRSFLFDSLGDVT